MIIRIVGNNFDDAKNSCWYKIITIQKLTIKSIEYKRSKLKQRKISQCYRITQDRCP
jgi:hypothetical protein